MHIKAICGNVSKAQGADDTVSYEVRTEVVEICCEWSYSSVSRDDTDGARCDERARSV
jgi:hypothetical protein